MPKRPSSLAKSVQNVMEAVNMLPRKEREELAHVAMAAVLVGPKKLVLRSFVKLYLLPFHGLKSMNLF
ncbi:hypothetical protein VCR31J2_1290210 [Vibrio coralliirubri]|uniref:Uncharacterized protein n=1 Tax=Vibrio coralliirubri TaxID=1516159 RepID=A0AA86WN15_9VIBR|nr:hypothetical protein VCR31J2_1290210 [Vibrio coralliirubri]